MFHIYFDSCFFEEKDSSIFITGFFKTLKKKYYEKCVMQNSVWRCSRRYSTKYGQKEDNGSKCKKKGK